MPPKTPHSTVHRLKDRALGFLDRQSSPRATARREALFGIRDVVLFAVLVAGVLGGGYAYATGWFRYPVELTYVRQFESQAGYVIELQAKSTTEEPVFIPNECFEVAIERDPTLVNRLSPDERKKLVHGESARVFDNRGVLEAVADGRSYANAATHMGIFATPRTLFLLVTVEGPGSSNPSARLALSPVYRTLVVRVRRRLVSGKYLEVPVRHVPIIAGDKGTQVIQR